MYGSLAAAYLRWLLITCWMPTFESLETV